MDMADMVDKQARYWPTGNSVSGYNMIMVTASSDVRCIDWEFKSHFPEILS